MEKLENIHYIIKQGVDLGVLRSGEEGIWFCQIGLGRTTNFLQFELHDKSEKNAKKLLNVMQYIFPFGEIIGQNTQGKCLLTIKLKAFSAWQQNKARRELMKLFPKRGIHNVTPLQA